MRIQEILTLSVINCLEDILQLESAEIKKLYQNLKILVEYLGLLNEFISQQAQQVLLGDVVIDIQLMNKQITECVKKSKEVITQHRKFFDDYNEIQDIISETTSNINESIQILSEIIVEVKNKNLKKQMQTKSQEGNEKLIKNLELQFLE